MEKYIYRGLLFTSLSLYLLHDNLSSNRLILVLMIGVSMLLMMIFKRIQQIIYCLFYLVFSLFCPELVIGYALLVTADLPAWLLFLLSTLTLIASPLMLKPILFCLIILVVFLNRSLKQSHQFLILQQRKQDQLQSEQLKAQENRQHLLLQQQNELEISVLNERNRIARDIHDNVGHLLTRSLLQVGALSTLNPSTDYTPLQETLNQAMSSVRASVHELYRKSLDLNQDIQQLFHQFPTLQVTYTYAIYSPLSILYQTTLLAIITESLTNTMKHAHADKVTLILDESLHRIHCTIQDNGQSTETIDFQKGIGLVGIEKRVHDLNGVISMSSENGFRTYLSLPKEASHETNRH